MEVKLLFWSQRFITSTCTPRHTLQTALLNFQDLLKLHNREWETIEKCKHTWMGENTEAKECHRPGQRPVWFSLKKHFLSVLQQSDDSLPKREKEIKTTCRSNIILHFSIRKYLHCCSIQSFYHDLTYQTLVWKLKYVLGPKISIMLAYYFLLLF